MKIKRLYGTMRIEESWPQVDGGRRYLLRHQLGTVTVDRDGAGNIDGFVRPYARFSKPDAALDMAITIVQRV
jgi:hypothetical protein